MSEKPAGLQYADDLEAEVTSEADRLTLEAWRNEINAERSELGVDSLRAPELIQNPDGSIVTAQEAQAAVQNGENPSGPYEGGNRA